MKIIGSTLEVTSVSVTFDQEELELLTHLEACIVISSECADARKLRELLDKLRHLSANVRYQRT